MKNNNIIFIIIAALFLSSCSFKSVPIILGPDYALFSKAEEFYKIKSYDKALNIYHEYLSKFADRSFADDSLMKIGDIYTEFRDYKKAYASYQRLIIEYSESSLIPDAQFKRLVIFYNEGNYERAIKEAELVPEAGHHLINLPGLVPPAQH